MRRQDQEGGGRGTETELRQGKVGRGSGRASSTLDDTVQ